MSTVRGSLIEIECKLLLIEETGIEVLVMPQAKRIRIPVIEEATGTWKHAGLGAMLTLRISQDLAQRAGLFQGNVMSNRPLGGGGALHG